MDNVIEWRTRVITNNLKNYMEEIAELHGCKVIFKNERECGYWNGILYIGTDGTFNETISSFCHELGHWINVLDGKWLDYHTKPHFDVVNKIGISLYVKDALQCEIYTDKIGKQICKEWFPYASYNTTYFNNKDCIDYLTNYFST